MSVYESANPTVEPSSHSASDSNIPSVSPRSRILRSLDSFPASPVPSSQFDYSPAPAESFDSNLQRLIFHGEYNKFSEPARLTDSVTVTSKREFSKQTKALNSNSNPLPVSVPLPSVSRWRLSRVLLGHTSAIRSVCVASQPSGPQFAVSAASDGLIKIWSLSNGALKSTFDCRSSGSIHSVVASSRSPYLFSCGEDHEIKCWDLTSNRVVRSYFGHASGVRALCLHDSIDLLFSGSRDNNIKMWDLRSKEAINTLAGHSGSVNSLSCQISQPSLISGSADATVKCWDFASGRCLSTLTQHSKSVRAVKFNPEANAFATAGGDKVKIFHCPDKLIKTFPGLALSDGSEAATSGKSFLRVINSMALSPNSQVLAVGGEFNRIRLFDWSTHLGSPVGEIVLGRSIAGQSGSVNLAESDEELNVNSLTFDSEGEKLISAGNDKSVRIYEKVH